MGWKGLTSLAALSTAVLLSAGVAGAAEGTASGVGVVSSTELGKVSEQLSTELTATVEALDGPGRTVTLKGPDGKLLTIMVGDEVRNFDQIKVGDHVRVRYSRGVVLQLVKGGGGVRQRIEKADANRAAEGQKPAGSASRVVVVVADVVAMDAENRTITLRGPERTVELRVKDPAQFENIAVGDQVEATFTEAVAISVQEAPGK